jgi:peroxiredoxin
MKKRVGTLIVYTAVLLVCVLGALIANNLQERDTILDRISQWPDVEVKTMDGETVSTAKLSGETPLLFIYFNTECIFCRNMFEEIIADGQLKQHARFLFVSDESPETIKEYRKHTGIDQAKEFLFFYDHDQKVRGHFDVRGVPATYLYDSEGNLIEFFRGQVKAETLHSHLTAAGD